jgi:hypothetical protein
MKRHTCPAETTDNVNIRCCLHNIWWDASSKNIWVAKCKRNDTEVFLITANKTWELVQRVTLLFHGKGYSETVGTLDIFIRTIQKNRFKWNTFPIQKRCPTADKKRQMGDNEQLPFIINLVDVK